MKKKLVLIGGIMFITMMVLNIGFSGNVNNDDYTISIIQKQALAEYEGSDGTYCYNGGPGSQSCSIAAGITILGYGVSAGCDVSCYPNYYACCTLRCTCVAF